MFQTFTLVLISFFAICVASCLSVENDNMPIKVDFDEVLKEEIERCKISVQNNLNDFSDPNDYYGSSLSNWISTNRKTPFLREDACATDVRQGFLNDCWLVSVESAILSAEMQKTFEGRFFVNTKDSIVGMVIFGKFHIPKCIRVSLKFPFSTAENRMWFASTFRDQMYAEAVEKVAAKEYAGYDSLKEGFPEQAHYLLTGSTDCTIYRNCLEKDGCKIDANLKAALPREFALKSAITATIYDIHPPAFGNKVQNAGLQLPHSYAVQELVTFKGRKSSDVTAPVDYTLVLVYDQSRVAVWKGPFGNTAQNLALNPGLAKMYAKLVPGQFYIELEDFKNYFPVITACRAPKNDKQIVFQGTFPNRYENIENMFGYKFEIGNWQNVRIKFDLMQHIPRSSTGLVGGNYPAVFVVWKLQNNGVYTIVHTSCYEQAFSIALEAEFTEGQYLLVPYSLTPLTRFYQFEPKYSLKISFDRSNSVEIEPTRLSPVDYWDKLSNYVTSNLNDQVSRCVDTERHCSQNYFQLYAMRSQGQEIWIIHNTKDYWLKVTLGLTVNAKRFVFWRGNSDTVDFVPPKTSIIANVIWYKSGFRSKAKEWVLAERVDANGQSSPTKFVFNGKLPESPPFIGNIAPIKSTSNPSTCRNRIIN